MRRQLRRLGLGHDTRREIATTDPGYYRWTQWIFLKIFNSWADERTGRARPIAELIAEFESGARSAPDGRPWPELTDAERHQAIDARRLAYISTETVNWCPGLGTVLANEEVTADGRSDIGNYPVYRRPMRQWMLRITALADRLIDDLDGWSTGRSRSSRCSGTGSAPAMGRASASLWRRGRGCASRCSPPARTRWRRHLPGACPGAPAGRRSGRRRPGPRARRRPGGSRRATTARRTGPRPGRWPRTRTWPARLSDRQRTEAYDKTGVFTGGYVDNPATGERLPVFLADYVLTGYGTGAIMAVPAHDGRDLDFAREFGLPVRAVLTPPPDWFEGHGIAAGTPAARWPAAFTGDGDYAEGPGPALAGLGVHDAVAAAIAWLEATGAGHGARSYRLRDWLFSRQRYWGEPFPIVFDSRGLPFALPEQALPVRLPDLADIRPSPRRGPQGVEGRRQGVEGRRRSRRPGREEKSRRPGREEKRNRNRRWPGRAAGPTSSWTWAAGPPGTGAS